MASAWAAMCSEAAASAAPTAFASRSAVWGAAIRAPAPSARAVSARAALRGEHAAHDQGRGRGSDQGEQAGGEHEDDDRALERGHEGALLDPRRDDPVADRRAPVDRRDRNAGEVDAARGAVPLAHRGEPGQRPADDAGVRHGARDDAAGAIGHRGVERHAQARPQEGDEGVGVEALAQHVADLPLVADGHRDGDVEFEVDAAAVQVGHRGVPGDDDALIDLPDLHGQGGAARDPGVDQLLPGQVAQDDDVPPPGERARLRVEAREVAMLEGGRGGQRLETRQARGQHEVDLLGDVAVAGWTDEGWRSAPRYSLHRGEGRPSA